MMNQSKRIGTFVIIQCLVAVTVTGLIIQPQHKHSEGQLNQRGSQVSTKFTATKRTAATETTKNWAQNDGSKNTMAMPHHPTAPMQKAKTHNPNHAQIQKAQLQTAKTGPRMEMYNKRPPTGAWLTQNTDPMARPTQNIDPMAWSSQNTKQIARPSHNIDPTAWPTRKTEQIARPSQNPDTMAWPSQSTQQIARPSQNTDPTAWPSQNTHPRTWPSQNTRQTQWPNHSVDPVPTKSGQTSINQQSNLNPGSQTHPIDPDVLESRMEKDASQQKSTTNEVEIEPTQNSNQQTRARQNGVEMTNVYPTQNTLPEPIQTAANTGAVVPEPILTTGNTMGNTGAIVPEPIQTVGNTMGQKNSMLNPGPPTLTPDMIQDHLDTMQDLFHDRMEALMNLKRAQSMHRHITGAAMFPSPTQNGKTAAWQPVDFHGAAMIGNDATSSQFRDQTFHPTSKGQQDPNLLNSATASHPQPATAQPAEQTPIAKISKQHAVTAGNSLTTQSGTLENAFNTNTGKTQTHMPQMAFFEHMSENNGVNKTRIHVLTTRSAKKQNEETKTSLHKAELNITTPMPEEEEEEEEEQTSQENMSVESTVVGYSIVPSSVVLTDGVSATIKYENIKPTLAFGFEGGIHIERINNDQLNSSQLITPTVVAWSDAKTEINLLNGSLYLSTLSSIEPSANFSITSSMDGDLDEIEESSEVQITSTMPITVTPTMFVHENTITTATESEETSGSLSISTLYPSPSSLTITASQQIEMKEIKPTATSSTLMLASKTPIPKHEKEEIKPTQVNSIPVTSSVNINTIDATSNKYATSTNESSNANQQGGTTKSAPIEHNLTVSATFGIVAGCLIAFWIIIGPIICLLLKASDKRKEKSRKLRAEMNRDSKENCIMEAMIMSELGRDVPLMNNSKFTIIESKADKNSDYLELAKDKSELENLKNSDETRDVMLP